MADLSEQVQHEDNDNSIIGEETGQDKKSQHIIPSVSDSFSKSHPINVPCPKQKKQEHTMEFTVRRSKRTKTPSQFLSYPSEATEDILLFQTNF